MSSVRELGPVSLSFFSSLSLSLSLRHTHTLSLIYCTWYPWAPQTKNVRKQLILHQIQQLQNLCLCVFIFHLNWWSILFPVCLNPQNTFAAVRLDLYEPELGCYCYSLSTFSWHLKIWANEAHHCCNLIVFNWHIYCMHLDSQTLYYLVLGALFHKNTVKHLFSGWSLLVGEQKPSPSLLFKIYIKHCSGSVEQRNETLLQSWYLTFFFFF